MRYRRQGHQAMMGQPRAIGLTERELAQLHRQNRRQGRAYMGHVGPYDTVERSVERNAMPGDAQFLTDRYMAGTGETAGVWSEVDFESLEGAALAAFAEGDYDGALALLDQAFELNPSPRHSWNQAVIYVAANEPAAALEILTTYEAVLRELVGDERFHGLFALASDELPAPPPTPAGFPFIPIAIAGAIMLALRRR